MTHRLKVDVEVQRAKEQGIEFLKDSVRKAYKDKGHFPFIRAALSKEEHRRVTHGVDGFDFLTVDILHNVSTVQRCICSPVAAACWNLNAPSYACALLCSCTRACSWMLL
jgi:hypothetical protein